MSEPSTHANNWDWKKLTTKTAEQRYFEDSAGMAIDTMTETIETDLIESCCDGGKITGPCTKPMIAKSTPVEEPPPKPDNHGPKKPIRKPRQFSINVECPRACLAFSQTMAEGANTHNEDEWRTVSVKELLVHADKHLAAYLAGDTSEEHLKHLHARVTMALETALLRGMKT